MDVKQVGRELGVRYGLEGSVRKAANRLRITGQLIDASNGAHICADRFNGAFADVFDLQDEVATHVVGAISPKIERAEVERAKRKPTGSLDAYDYFLHGMATDHDWTREANNEALRLLYKAVEIDPDFASAHGMAAMCYSWRKAHPWMVDRTEEVAEGSRLARKAVSLGKDDAVALSRGGFTLAYVANDLDAGSIFIHRALTLNPNLAFAWLAIAWLKVWLGEPEAALQHLAHTIRLSPLDSMIPVIQNAIAVSGRGRAMAPCIAPWFGRLRCRREERRPDRNVSQRRVHRNGEHGSPAGTVGARRARCAGPAARAAADRQAIRRGDFVLAGRRDRSGGGTVCAGEVVVTRWWQFLRTQANGSRRSTDRNFRKSRSLEYSVRTPCWNRIAAT